MDIESIQKINNLGFDYATIVHMNPKDASIKRIKILGKQQVNMDKALRSAFLLGCFSIQIMGTVVIDYTNNNLNNYFSLKKFDN